MAGDGAGAVEELERRIRRSDADERGADAARLREKLQGRRRDDPERAFRADEEILEIVAGVVLA